MDDRTNPLQLTMEGVTVIEGAGPVDTIYGAGALLERGEGPGVKGRTIFGGLVPYGELWETGANEATTITFTGDVLVEGEEVPAGTYSLFSIPGQRKWTIILNRDYNQWGIDGYDESEDVLRCTVPVGEAPFAEHLTFGFTNIGAFAASVALRWATTRIAFRIEEP